MIDSHVHSLDNCVDLMPSLRAFRLLAVEHDSVFHLVKQTATFRIGEGNDDVFLLVPQVLTRPSDGATSTSARDERIDEATSLPPDLGACPVQVGVIVASILPHP